MTEAEIYQKQVETCKQVQDMINALYISKDKIRDKIKDIDKKLDELAEKEHNWNKMNEVQQMEHQLLKNRYTNYHNVLNELLEEK